MPRNPPWQYDELVLALDLYFRNPRARNSKNDPGLAEVSSVLRGLPLDMPRPDPETFRGVNSVYLKLQNFKAIDSEYTDRGLRGMRAGAQGREQALWDSYVERPDALEELARQIRMRAEADELPTTEEEDEAGSVEGRFLYRQHRQRERDAGLVRKKKARVLQETGRLACEVCDLDFEARYGPLGRGFIECHHVIPLHEAGESLTQLRDLAVVCPNCHRMLHRPGETVGVAGLRGIVRSRP